MYVYVYNTYIRLTDKKNRSNICELCRIYCLLENHNNVTKATSITGISSSDDSRVNNLGRYMCRKTHAHTFAYICIPVRQYRPISSLFTHKAMRVCIYYT